MPIIPVSSPMRKLLIFLLLLLCCLSVPAQRDRTQRKQTTTQRSTQKKSAVRNRKSTSTRKQATSKTTQRQQGKGKKSAVTVKGLENERKALQAEKASNIKKNERIKLGVKRGVENLMMLDQEIAQQRKVVDTIRNDVTRLSDHIRLLDRQYEILTEELEERRNRYMQSMRYMHRNRSVQNQLMFIFSADNFNQMYRRLRFSREYAAYQKAQGEAVKSKQEQVEQKKEELRQSKEQKNVLLARGVKEQQVLEGKQNQQQAQVEQLKKQQKTVEALIVEQQRREEELNARIDRLIAEELARERARLEAEAKKKAAEEAARKRAEELARKRAAAEAARKENERRIAEARKREQEARAEARRASKRKRAEAERKAREAELALRRAEQKAREEDNARERDIAEAKKNEENYRIPAEDRKMTGGFETNRGRLPIPITGAYRLVRGFGPYHPEGLSRVRLQSNGWHLKGQGGAKARCVFDGEVSGVYMQAGKYIVTVRHGKYISAYINLANVSVKKGQRVKARDILGSLGADQTMQFQLRNWSTLLNPANWLGR